MALKTLFLGILFSVGIFAIKSGFGIRYCIAGCNSPMKKVMAYSGFSLTYALLFFLSALWINTMEFMAWFPLFQIIIKYAMPLHFILAGLMIIWGVFILLSPKTGKNKTLGWIPLSLPCPVCATVIFLSVAFLTAFYPGSSSMSVFLLFTGFILLNLLTLLLVHFFEQNTKGSSESILGSAMLFVAAYFILSVLIMPQFTGIEEIYSMSVYSCRTGGGLTMEKVVVFTLMTCLFSAGMMMTTHKNHESSRTNPVFDIIYKHKPINNKNIPYPLILFIVLLSLIKT